MDYNLALPKRRPSMNYADGFEDMPDGSMTPAAGAAPQGQPGWIPGASFGLNLAGAAFDTYGAIEQADRQDKIDARAWAEYIRQRDQEAEDRRKRDQIQEVKEAFDWANYGAGFRKGLGDQYGGYFAGIGL